ESVQSMPGRRGHCSGRRGRSWRLTRQPEAPGDRKIAPDIPAAGERSFVILFCITTRADAGDAYLFDLAFIGIQDGQLQSGAFDDISRGGDLAGQVEYQPANRVEFIPFDLDVELFFQLFDRHARIGVDGAVIVDRKEDLFEIIFILDIPTICSSRSSMVI